MQIKLKILFFVIACLMTLIQINIVTFKGIMLRLFAYKLYIRQKKITQRYKYNCQELRKKSVIRQSSFPLWDAKFDNFVLYAEQIAALCDLISYIAVFFCLYLLEVKGGQIFFAPPAKFLLFSLI